MRRTMVFVALSCILFCANTAWAAVPWQVFNNNDSGVGSLREAIAASNTTPAVQTVTFTPGMPLIQINTSLPITAPIVIEGRGVTIQASTNAIFLLNAGSDGSRISQVCLVGTGLNTAISLVSSNNRISGCCIGIYWNGTTFATRTSGGIYIDAGSNNNLIGGDRTAGEGNVVSYCTSTGIEVYGAGNTLAGNIIGLTWTQSASMGNEFGGILVNNRNNTIGLPLPGWGNILCSNTGLSAIFCGLGSRDTIIQNNLIGLNSANAYIGNDWGGIRLMGPAQVGVPGVAGSKNVLNNDPFDLSLECGGNTVVGNFFGTNQAGTAVLSSPTSRILVSESNNWIGLQGGEGNLIAGGSRGISLSSAAAFNDGIYGNTICGSSIPIELVSGANHAQAAPVILIANTGSVSGQAAPGDYVEVFRAARGNAFRGGSLRYLGAATADGIGQWNLPVAGLAEGNYVCALASDSGNNTSAFSWNAVVNNNTPTPSITVTHTQSPTATTTASMTPTLTASPTPSGTASLWTSTPTATQTATQVPTATATPTASGLASSTVTSTPTLWLEYRLPEGREMLAFPNPAHQQVTFLLNIAAAAEVKIVIINISGEPIASLTANPGAGLASLPWMCQGVAPGVYLAQIRVGNHPPKVLKIAVLGK